MNRICLSGIIWYIIRYLRVILDEYKPSFASGEYIRVSFTDSVVDDQIYPYERRPILYLHFSRRIGAYLIGFYRLISQWFLRVIHSLFLVFQSSRRTFDVLLMGSFSMAERPHVQIQRGLSDTYSITSFYNKFY